MTETTILNDSAVSEIEARAGDKWTVNTDTIRALCATVKHLWAENEALRKEVANSEKYQAQLLDSDGQAAEAADRKYFCSCGGALTAEEYIVHYFELGHDRGDPPASAAPVVDEDSEPDIYDLVAQYRDRMMREPVCVHCELPIALEQSGWIHVGSGLVTCRRTGLAKHDGVFRAEPAAATAAPVEQSDEKTALVEAHDRYWERVGDEPSESFSAAFEAGWDARKEYDAEK